MLKDIHIILKSYEKIDRLMSKKTYIERQKNF